MDPRQMRMRCPKAIAVGRVALGGYRFLINRRGVATIEKDARATVAGVLWKVSPQCETSLDRFEGVLWGFYQKRKVAVCDDEGIQYFALVYIDPVCERGVPREGYMEQVLLGARRAGIPQKNFAAYLHWARRHAA